MSKLARNITVFRGEVDVYPGSTYLDFVILLFSGEIWL